MELVKLSGADQVESTECRQNPQTTTIQNLFYQEEQAKLAKGAALRPMIEIRGLTKVFDGQTAVESVDLQINLGEIFALLGGSGCGKSTLLRMLSGFESPTHGEISIDGKSMLALAPHQRPTNMMFQSYALFPHMNVEQNIAYGLKQESLPKREICARVDELLTLVHMESFRKRKPHQLSGGQRQRVALARSLAKRPKVLLLDEPMGALDKKLRNQMQLELVDIIKQVGVTCVMVTHDQEEAMTMADRVAVMNQGALVQVGTPHDIYEYPNCLFTAEFIGSVNIFEGQAIEEGPDHVLIRCDNLQQLIHIDHGVSGPAGQHVQVALRPEKLTISDKQPEHQHNWAAGTIAEIAYLGAHSIYHVQLTSGQIVQATRSNRERREIIYRPEDSVFVQWACDSAVVFES